MEIREALDAMHAERAALESRLRWLIAAEMKSFTEITGVFINGASIEFIECTRIDAKHREFMLGQLRVSIATD